MKISVKSHNIIAEALGKALEKYSEAAQSAVTDIQLQPHIQSGELTILNDDDEVLGSVVVEEWIASMPENFYEDAEVALKRILNQLGESEVFASLRILKPYSFVLVDEEKETVAELMLIDDEETMFLSDELLKGLDDELNSFLKDLLEI